LEKLQMTEDTQAGRDRLEIDNMFLCGSRFTRVSLKDAFFGDTHLMGAELNDVNASGLKVENVNLSGARFHNVNLSDVSISAANLSGLSIEHATLDGMTINGIDVVRMLDLWHQKNGGT
jgi:uncharacterized protein YjbI with pentapeptide repeats